LFACDEKKTISITTFSTTHFLSQIPSIAIAIYYRVSWQTTNKVHLKVSLEYFYEEYLHF